MLTTTRVALGANATRCPRATRRGKNAHAARVSRSACVTARACSPSTAETTPRVASIARGAREMRCRAPRDVACASTAVARASGEADAGAAAPSTFLVGIAWFFAHQLIGVGNDVIMKFTGANLGVAQVVFLRFLFATLTMVPVMLAGGKESWKTDRAPLHVARSALLAGGIFLYVKGLTIAPIAVVTTLNFTIPLFTLVLASVVLKEKVDSTRWLGTLVGFAGVTVVISLARVALSRRDRSTIGQESLR